MDYQEMNWILTVISSVVTTLAVIFITERAIRKKSKKAESEEKTDAA